MAISLQEQLLKAGVASKQQAKKAKQAKKKQKKGQAPEDNRKQQAELEAARQQKAERDRALNRQRQEEQARKAATAEVRQLIARHAVQRPKDGETCYNFIHEKKVKQLWINDSLLAQLARGQLRIAFFDGQYQLLPADVAERVEQRLAAVILPRPEPEQPEEEDPYKDYPIPDDLMW